MTLPCARRIQIRGVVQGVGFRPHVYRLACAHGLAGWVANGENGVEIHAEGGEMMLEAFVRDLSAAAPLAARISDVQVMEARLRFYGGFEIRSSRQEGRPTTRISPDLPICESCLQELFDPSDPRAHYPYINCTACGPRFSIIRGLPYDRARTTMAEWQMCSECARQYGDAADRRFHAQPIACPRCGPQYLLVRASGGDSGLRGMDAIAEAVRLLRAGFVVAIKGIGGYHLACDAANAPAVWSLRERKYRKEQAFALLVRDAAIAHATCALTADANALLRSAARPIVLGPRRIDLPGVAPDNGDLGVMLPYAPIHHLLFALGAPERLVMTSGNRSSEPTSFNDADACRRLSGLADALLVGERPIARRVDDSVVKAGVLGPVILRRSRGLAPGAAAVLPLGRPVLALGGDLKNTVTLVVDGQAYVSQHIGDLDHYDARRAFRETAADLVAMYELDWGDLLVVHDRHPDYESTRHALELRVQDRLAVQHHHAHIASVLAEREALDRRVVGVALDGTGYGDDGTIWGGELFVGSVLDGFERAAHLRRALLPGGDAAARHPVQAAAGYLATLPGLPDLTARPFLFPERYRRASMMAQRSIRTFSTTSTGRLFDVVAALVGFTRPITFEGQAALWLEHLARQSGTDASYAAPLAGAEIDWRALLAGVIEDRLAGVEPSDIARAFHRGLAGGIAAAAAQLLGRFRLDTVVLSGGAAQNMLLAADFCQSLADQGVHIWTNRVVPPNDGGLSLGQAAMAARVTGRLNAVSAERPS